MSEVDIRYMVYRIENQQRLLQAEHNYQIQQALKTIPKRSLIRKVLFRLGSWLIELAAKPDQRPASGNPRWIRQHS